MKKYLFILPLLMFAVTAFACNILPGQDERLIYNYGETEMVQVEEEWVKVMVDCRIHNTGNGMIVDTPCLGLKDEFKANCEAENTQVVSEVVLGTELSLESQLEGQIRNLQTQLIELLTQLLTLLMSQV